MAIRPVERNELAGLPAHGLVAGRQALTRAWIAVLFIPVGFVLAFVVGDGVASLLDSPVGDEVTPEWVMWLVSVPAILVFLVPCAAAVGYGRRARQSGRHSGLVPLVIGAVLGFGWLGLNIAAGIFQ